VVSRYARIYARIPGDPELRGEERFDALMGAIGEHLSRRWQLGPPPGLDRRSRAIFVPPLVQGTRTLERLQASCGSKPGGISAPVHRRGSRTVAARPRAARRLPVGL
jgi:hypothetical protein